MKKFMAAAPVFAAIVSSPVIAFSETVELRSLDGLNSIEGTITRIEDEIIALATEVGEIRVPRADVNCLGTTCPSNKLEIVADDAKRHELVARLLASDVVASLSETVVNFSTSNAALIGTDEHPSLAAFRLINPGTLSSGDVRVGPTALSPSSGIQNLSTSTWADPETAKLHHLGTEVLGVVVEESAGISAISVSDVSKIFAGEISNWKELGGNDVEVTPVQVNSDSLELAGFIDGVMAPRGLSLGQGNVSVANSEQALDHVSYTKGGVVVLPIGQTIGYPTLPVMNACGQAVPANQFTVQTGLYPLKIETVARVDGTPTPFVTRFFDAIATGEVQDQVSSFGYADITTLPVPAKWQTERISQVVNTDTTKSMALVQKELLRTFFDGAQLSMRLDAAAQTPLDGAIARGHFVRLAEAITNGQYDGHDIFFMGYSDKFASDLENLDASRRSAEAVLAAFEKFAPEAAQRASIALVAQGNGPMGHINCSDQQAAVEVWVRPAG